MSHVYKLLLGLGVLSWLTASSPAIAEEYPKPYDGLQAGEDAHRYFDFRRREAVKRQLNTIEWMKWWGGFPASPQPETMYYRDPPSLDSIYATGRHSRFDASGRRHWPHVPDVFEPWPYVPGDIYGYRDYFPVPQPIGRREIQTGPNRWESHPIYSHEPKPPVEELSPAARPKLEATGPRDF